MYMFMSLCLSVTSVSVVVYVFKTMLCLPFFQTKLLDKITHFCTVINLLDFFPPPVCETCSVTLRVVQ